MYQRSIIIATGAGMAPYLSLLPTLPRGRHRLIWVGRSFREYFGDKLYDMALQWPDLVLVDTTKSGRPDMTALAAEHYREFGADAVFVGSNPEGTKQVVSGCRALGIPAFGPSWDS
jgi:ferredoxin-NADP reductase